MDPSVAHLAITDLVRRIRRHLETVASVAKAGVACAEAGSPGRAVGIVIELGEDLHEIDRLFGAALAISAEA
jgi:hypothetical protein